MLSGLGSDLAPRGFCGFSLPRRPAHRQPGPPRADSNLPPGPRCPPPGEGPGPHLTEVQLSPQARSPGAGLHLAAGRPRGAGGFPCPGAGRWAVPGRGGCGRPSSRGGVGGRPRKLCGAVTARWPQAAARPRRLPLRRADAGAPPRSPLPWVAAASRVPRFPARVRALPSPRLLPAGQMGRASFGLELEPPELAGCRSLVNFSFC